MPPELPRLVTVKEASVYLFGRFDRALRQRVYNLMDAQGLAKIKDGKQFYIPRAALQRLAGEE